MEELSDGNDRGDLTVEEIREEIKAICVERNVNFEVESAHFFGKGIDRLNKEELTEFANELGI